MAIADRGDIVSAAMRTRFEHFSKRLVRSALQAHGSIETETEVHADTRRIDLWFTPDPALAPLSDQLGLLGQITAAATTLEFFHDTPSGDDLAACVIKHGEFRHVLSLRVPPPPPPIQWVISSGCPRSGIQGLWLRRMKHWTSGIYEAAPLLWTRLVVVNELPVRRDTLLLRLLGSGRVLQRAIAEVKTLQREAPERALAVPILLRSRLEVPADPVKRTKDDEEFLMITQDIVETWRREAVQEGFEQGRQQGIEQGREQGIEQGRERGIARSLLDVYEARFGALPEDLRAVIERTHDESTLRGWLVLTSTRSEDEIAAAIRAARPS